MDYYKVIILGHRAKQPLIRSPSELVDGSEPHDHIYSGYTAAARTGSHAGYGSRCTRGGGLGGYREGGIPGTSPRPDLRLI